MEFTEWIRNIFLYRLWREIMFCILRYYDYQSLVRRLNWNDYVDFHINAPPLHRRRRRLLIPNSVDSQEFHLRELAEKSENREGQKQKSKSHVSTALWIPGQCGTSEFLSPLSRITVSWNWKHREIQILTLPDICMTLGTLNSLSQSAYASTYRCAYQTMAFCGSTARNYNWDKEAAVKVSFCPSYNII